MNKKIIIAIMAFAIFISMASAALSVSLADHGSNIRNKTSGSLLSSGDLRVEIYDALSGGNLIYNETFTGGIVNGSWNVMLGENSSNSLSLEFGRKYYKDYLINGENVNFTNLTGENVGRQFFYSPLGDINVSYIVNSSWITWATANNGTLLNYSSALNGTLATWANVGNGTVAFWSNVVNGTMLSYAQALNNTLMQQANWNATNTSYTTWAIITNGTMLSYAQALNGTLASWANVVNGTVLTAETLWNANYSNMSIGWLYATNSTGTLSSESDPFWTGNYSNFTVGWYYATNSTGGSDTFIANYTNFTTLYGNQYTNYTNFTTTYGHALGWANNATNFTVVYGYALNATDTDTFVANYSTYLTKPTWSQVGNGTVAFWSNVVNGTMLSYANALNNTLMQQANWNATNTSYRTADNTTFIGNFSFNGGWESGGFSIINGDIYAQTGYFYNITSLNVSQQNLSIINDFLVFGNTELKKNLTVDSNTLFINSNTDRVGILTTTPQNTLNVIGDINATTIVWSEGKNLSKGYDYAINSTGGGGG